MTGFVGPKLARCEQKCEPFAGFGPMPRRPAGSCDTHPAAGSRTFEELLQREQERGCIPGWARPVGATRQRTTAKGSTLRRTGSRGAMTTVSATEARKRLYALIDEVGQSHEPVQITGKRGNAVLLSEDDWRAIQETLHLVSIPGMRESILEGMATEVSELSSEPLW